MASWIISSSVICASFCPGGAWPGCPGCCAAPGAAPKLYVWVPSIQSCELDVYAIYLS